MTANNVRAWAIGIILLTALPAPAMSQAMISESADTILRMMSDYFGGLQKFSASYDTDTEFITGAGQKLQINTSGRMTVQRPNGAHFTRDGEVSSTEIFYDGKSLTLFGKKINSYFSIESEGGIGQAIEDFRLATGLAVPGADLLAADPYAILIDGVLEGEFIANTTIDGVPAYHLAFREADVDWQLWVRADDHPVPLKYVITTKWMTGAPQYTVTLRNWNFQPEIAETEFKFSPPQGAIKVDHLEVNELGELVIVGAE